MRTRLRPVHSAEKIKSLYNEQYYHTRWNDHKVRTEVTIAIINILTPYITSAADLSAGDGFIINSLNIQNRILGDIVPQWEHCGPIEETIHKIPHVDLFILSETLEHLDDPDDILRLIRDKATYLLLSTPLGETEDINEEHYWGWDKDGILEMVTAAGFAPSVYNELYFLDSIYNFQIWLLK